MTMPPTQPLPADSITWLVAEVAANLQRVGFTLEATATAAEIVARAARRVRLARRPRPHASNGNGGPPLPSPN